MLVEVVYEIVNGMCGMKRDIVLHLCCWTWNQCKKNEIKAIIGMCEEHYLWKGHRSFLKKKPFGFKNYLIILQNRHSVDGIVNKTTELLDKKFEMLIFKNTCSTDPNQIYIIRQQMYDDDGRFIDAELASVQTSMDLAVTRVSTKRSNIRHGLIKLQSYFENLSEKESKLPFYECVITFVGRLGEYILTQSFSNDDGGICELYKNLIASILDQ